ncbi:MAG: hypothetical protein ACQEVA_05570 [Myxococcota bacterium]
MKTAAKMTLAALVAICLVGCADAMDEPIQPEARSVQQLDLEGAEFDRVRPMLQECHDCYELVLMRQTTEEGDESADDARYYDKRQIDRSTNAFDGDPVPWPLDEKRED